MKKIVSLLIFALCAGNISAREKFVMRYEDKIRIREAINISDKYMSRVWEGIGKTPFVVLLVTDSAEFLINHHNPSEDFKLSENDTILSTRIFYRPQQFSKHLLATFPAVGGVSCIVVGTPENTGRNSTEWIITLLHEHFHQYQATSPGYYTEVNGLDLANGDETGMWQLNFPLRYEDSTINKQNKKYSSSLASVLQQKRRRLFEKSFQEYLSERKKLQQLLRPDEYRYLSFQIWQEGLASYTEYKILLLLDKYRASPELSRLPDYIPFFSLAQKMYNGEIKNLTSLELKKEKRICFYSLGFGEGLLLDKLEKNWRQHYLSSKFFIEKYSNKFALQF